MSNYATRMNLAKPSFIRESLKLAADPSIISFAGGNPDADFFPVADIRNCVTTTLDNRSSTVLQYSISEGYPQLRNTIIQMMSKTGVSMSLDNIITTTGSQQGLDLVAKMFINSGDEIIVESPTYMGAINAFKYYEPSFIEVEMDENGMQMDALEKTLKDHSRVKFIYTIPDYQNPTGISLSVERRQRMVELAAKYNVLILEDNPYYYIRFPEKNEKVPPPIKSFDRADCVIYLGSFSKILCPGIRVGWMCGPEDIIQKAIYLKQACELHTAELTQEIVAEYLTSCNLEAHLQEVCESYKKKKDLMVGIIRSSFPPSIKYTNPDGGLFLWLQFPSQYDTQALFEKAYQKIGVIFVPGDTFYPYGGHPNTARLSFATASAENIEIGMNKLAAFFREEMDK